MNDPKEERARLMDLENADVAAELKHRAWARKAEYERHEAYLQDLKDAKAHREASTAKSEAMEREIKEMVQAGARAMENRPAPTTQSYAVDWPSSDDTRRPHPMDEPQAIILWEEISALLARMGTDDGRIRTGDTTNERRWVVLFMGADINSFMIADTHVEALTRLRDKLAEDWIAIQEDGSK